MGLLTIENRAGETVTTGSRRLTLFSQVVRLGVPGLKQGGLIWNRPTAVLVQEADGVETTLPVQDVTRMAQIFFFSLGLFGGCLIWLASQRVQQK